MINKPPDPGRLTAGREPLRRPAGIVMSTVLIAVWWAYALAVDVALLAEVGGAGNWLALGCCTVAIGAVLRGLWHGGPLAWRVVHRFAVPVAAAFLVGAGIMLVLGPNLGSLVTTPADPALIAAAGGGLLAVPALLASGLLVRTASARAWCGQ
jgi:hypothetical protein